MKKSLLSSILLSVSLCTFSQSDQKILDDVVEKFYDYHNTHIVEKAYLHLEKSIYTPGEDIWFKAYLLDGTFHRPTKLSTILYVELIDPDLQIIDSRNINIKDGVGTGDFLLADSLKSGTYLVRAYSEYMKNFDLEYVYAQKVKVINVNASQQLEFPQSSKLPSSTVQSNPKMLSAPSELDIQFFPEGGNIIDKLVNTIAFKAVDNNGKSIEISGNVVNNKGEEVVNFDSSKFGMGKFLIIPNAGEEYTAIVLYKQKRHQFKLPKSTHEGYLMSVRNNEDNVFVTVQNNMDVSMKNTFLIGHTRGVIFSSLRVVDGKDRLYVTIPMDSIPSGIAHFTFFDKDGIPRTERLIYSRNETDKTSLEIKNIRNEYESREKVEFALALKDAKGKLIDGNISIAINMEILSQADANSTIQNNLLLSSDLKGPIENPNYYFNEENQDRHEALDLLMLTQGWRRFSWTDLLQKKLPTLDYYPEKTFRVSGQLLKANDRTKTIAGDISLNVLEDLSVEETISTDKNGQFSFEGLTNSDSLTIMLRATKTQKLVKKKSKTLKTNEPIFISIDQHQSPEINHFRQGQDVFQTNTINYVKQRSSNQGVFNPSSVKKSESDLLLDQNVRVLEEIKIKRSIDRSRDLMNVRLPGQIYSRPTRRLALDSIPNKSTALSVFDLLTTRVPGVIVMGQYPDQSVVIRGFASIQSNNVALYLIDGMPVDANAVSSILPSNISHVDILSGASATMYGSRAMNGVLAIYTKTTPTQEDQPISIQPKERKNANIISFKHPGYYKARTFYTPKYEQKEVASKSDFRNTLYWNPEVQVSNKKEVSLEFHTSDEKGTYLVQIEGITDDGSVIFGQSFFTVQ